jgi:hypothetical protein
MKALPIIPITVAGTWNIVVSADQKIAPNLALSAKQRDCICEVPAPAITEDYALAGELLLRRSRFKRTGLLVLPAFPLCIGRHLQTGIKARLFYLPRAQKSPAPKPGFSL